jgi:hypothetical protein
MLAASSLSAISTLFMSFYSFYRTINRRANPCFLAVIRTRRPYRKIIDPRSEAHAAREVYVKVKPWLNGIGLTGKKSEAGEAGGFLPAMAKYVSFV